MGQLVHRTADPRLAPGGVLVALSVVADRAGSEEHHVREAVFAELVPQVAARLQDPSRTNAALALLSWKGPLMRSRPKARRHAAAEALGMHSGDSFRRRHEDPLIADLARAFVAVEVAYRARHREIDTAALDWPGRFASYGRIYSAVSGLRGDLEIVVRAEREKPGEFDYLMAQLGSSLWFYSRFLAALEEFECAYGGMWLLSDPDAETEVANAIQHINRDTALNEHDASWLRTELRRVADHELDPFLGNVSINPRGQEILHAWVSWCSSCACPSVAAPERACEVHAVIEACRDYTEVLDRDIRQLAEPHRESLGKVPEEDVAALIKRFGAVRTRD